MNTRVTVIPLGKEADLSAARTLQAQLTAAPRDRPVVVDLTELPGITSVVLGVLFSSAKHGRRVSLVVPDEERRTILTRIRAEILVDVHPSLELAVAAASADDSRA
jgi:anti-anti-sigma regulatory factor